MSFRSKLEARVAATKSLLCVGLDPHERELFPPAAAEGSGGDGGQRQASRARDEDRCDAAFTFCKTLVDATAPYAACYKPNAAFFEALGDGGMSVLKRVCRDVIPPDIPVLLDAKRGDIGSTAAAYAEACYNHVGADAVTLSPLMGWDSVSPFVTDKFSHKGAFLLCKTSNPGSNEILALNLTDNETIYERIAKLVGTDWSDRVSKGADGAVLGLVVGATDPTALRKAREAGGEGAWILAPGVGAQGGDLLSAVRAGLNSSGTGLLVPVSRGISRAPDPSQAARELHENIQSVREQVAAQKSRDPDASNDHAGDIKPYQREFLEFSLSQGVLKFGSFVLKSGRTSPYFFNAGLFATGAALHKLGRAYASTIMSSSELSPGSGRVNFDVVFGPAYKGISLGAVVSAALYSDFRVDVGFAYNRKEAKDHGEGGVLVGASMEGKRILVVDDVITAGTAIRESYGMLKTVGAVPVGVVIAMDRAEVRSAEDRVSAVQAVARDLSLPVVSIASLPQLQAFLERTPGYAEETLSAVANYRKEYGV